MKKNLYYRTVFKRTNVIKMAILSFFLAICSWPRLMLEVFTRKNMGERYFSLVSAVGIFLILLWVPIMIERYENYHFSTTFWYVVRHNVIWYLFTLAFLVTSIKRRIEISQKPGVFDFERFSLSNGEINPLFYRINIFGRKPTPRHISIFWEPLFFLLVGMLFNLFGSQIGQLIIICSVIYSLSYIGAFSQGDDFIMDKIDEMICNDEMANVFLEELDPSETRGVPNFGTLPEDIGLRQRVMESVFEDEGFEVR